MADRATIQSGAMWDNTRSFAAILAEAFVKDAKPMYIYGIIGWEIIEARS